jgi:hypothetical protein
LLSHRIEFDRDDAAEFVSALKWIVARAPTEHRIVVLQALQSLTDPIVGAELARSCFPEFLVDAAQRCGGLLLWHVLDVIGKFIEFVPTESFSEHLWPVLVSSIQTEQFRAVSLTLALKLAQNSTSQNAWISPFVCSFSALFDHTSQTSDGECLVASLCLAALLNGVTGLQPEQTNSILQFLDLVAPDVASTKQRIAILFVLKEASRMQDKQMQERILGLSEKCLVKLWTVGKPKPKITSQDCATEIGAEALSLIALIWINTITNCERFRRLVDNLLAEKLVSSSLSFAESFPDCIVFKGLLFRILHSIDRLRDDTEHQQAFLTLPCMFRLCDCAEAFSKHRGTCCHLASEAFSRPCNVSSASGCLCRRCNSTRIQR